MTKKQTSLTKGAIFQTTGKIFLEGIAFFTTPIFTRILTPSDYGKMSVYMTWCSLLALFIGLQVGGSIANAKIEYSDEKIDGYMSSIMTIAIISCLLFILIAIVFLKPLATFINIREDLIFFLVIQSFCAFCIDFYNAKLVQFKRADKSMYLMTSVSVLSTALSLIFVFALPVEKYISKIYGAGIPIVIIGLFLCILVVAKGKVFFRREYWKFCLPLTLPLIFHGAGNLILSQSDKIMLQKMIGESETGIYSISVTVSAVVTTIFMAFNTAWVPYYYEYKKKDDIETILIHSKNYIFNISGLYVGFLLVVPEVFRILVPDVYWATGLKVIPFLTLSSFFHYLYLFPVNHEFFNKNTKMIAIGTFISALVNIVLNFFFIQKISALGAAFATCISSLLLFLFHLIIASKVIKKFEYSLAFYLRGIIPISIALLLYFIFSEVWWLRWIMAIVVGAILCVRFVKRRSLF